MTKEILNRIKTITTWLGVFVTLIGILLGMTTSGNWRAGVVSLIGLTITSVGHLVTSRLAVIQKIEKEADKKLIDTLSDRVLELVEKTRTRTISERLMDFFTRVDSQFPMLLANGQRSFLMNLRTHDYGVLKQIEADDQEGRIVIKPSTNTRMDNEGPIIEVMVTIDDAIFKK